MNHTGNSHAMKNTSILSARPSMCPIGSFSCSSWKRKRGGVVHLPDLTRSYEILRGLTRSHEVLRDLTRSHGILRGLTRSYEVSRDLTRSHGILRGLTGSYEVSRDLTRSCKNSRGLFWLERAGDYFRSPYFLLQVPAYFELNHLFTIGSEFWFWFPGFFVSLQSSFFKAYLLAICFTRCGAHFGASLIRVVQEN